MEVSYILGSSLCCKYNVFDITLPQNYNQKLCFAATFTHNIPTSANHVNKYAKTTCVNS